MGCDCKCGKCEWCVDGDCWTCPSCPPPPQCGCGQDLTNDESCINSTYYYYGNNSGSPIYYQFDFQYVIFEPVSGGGSVDQTIQDFMYSWFYWCGGSGSSGGPMYTMTFVGFGTSLPSGYTLEGSVSANNCVMWQSDWDTYISNNSPGPPSNPPNDIFTPYNLTGVPGCSYGYPGDTEGWCPDPNSNSN
jgi:hypothetical protein